MTDHIKKIREACVAANPEIMEPSFGCEVKYPKDDGGLVHKVSGYSVDEVNGEEAITAVDLMIYNGSFETVPVADVEILGRPILAQDVLKTLPGYWMLHHCGNGLEFINTHNMGKKSFKNEYRIWKGDRLEHQSPETLEFIASLL